MKQNALSSSATTRDRVKSSTRQGKASHHELETPEAPMDADALRALEWLRRGKPANEVVYDDDSPQQTEKELASFEPASYVREKPKKKG